MPSMPGQQGAKRFTGRQHPLDPRAGHPMESVAMDKLSLLP